MNFYAQSCRACWSDLFVVFFVLFALSFKKTVQIKKNAIVLVCAKIIHAMSNGSSDHESDSIFQALPLVSPEKLPTIPIEEEEEEEEIQENPNSIYVFDTHGGEIRKRTSGVSTDPTEDVSPSLRKRKKKKKKKKPRRSLFQVLRDWSACFERGILRVEGYAETVIHWIFLVVQWVILTFQRIGSAILWKINVLWASRFLSKMNTITRGVSVEERPAMTNRSREYIWILYKLRMKFLFAKKKRFRWYKFVFVTVFLIVLFCMGLFYSAGVAEYNTHIQHVHRNAETGEEIFNLLYPPSLTTRYNEDIDWLLYTLRTEKPGEFHNLGSSAFASGYVEISTRRFSRVNISIDEMTHRMLGDSARLGRSLKQPCLCATHYGIPLNIILVRYSLNNDDDVEDIIYYEPRAVMFVSDSIRVNINSDSFVVPKDVQAKKSKGMSPLEADFQDKLRVFEDSLISEKNLFLVDMTDAFTGEYIGKRDTSDVNERKKIYSMTRDILSDNTINYAAEVSRKTDYPVEVSIAYSQIGIRGLNARGEKIPVVYIDPPYAFCVQRCLAAMNPYF